MKIARLPLQAVALLLQIYFIVETIRLYIDGYVMFMGEPVENSWFSLLTTLVIVVACEIVSLADAALFIRSQKSKYSKIYFALVIINACCFMTMSYYSNVGTTICMSLYAILFMLRIVNLALNSIDIFKHLSKKRKKGEVNENT